MGGAAELFERIDRTLKMFGPQIGKVARAVPMMLAALTPAATIPIASATRALRWINTKTPPNMMKPSPDAATATQARPFIKVYKALIAIP